jgi:hypothetical protein
MWSSGGSPFSTQFFGTVIHAAAGGRRGAAAAAGCLAAAAALLRSFSAGLLGKAHADQLCVHEPFEFESRQHATQRLRLSVASGLHSSCCVV